MWSGGLALIRTSRLQIGDTIGDSDRASSPPLVAPPSQGQIEAVDGAPTCGLPEREDRMIEPVRDGVVHRSRRRVSIQLAHGVALM